MNIAVKVDAEKAAAEAYATPLAELNPAKVERFQDDTLWPVFERLRAEDPVHFTPESEFGPYWSMTTLGRHHGGRHRPRGLLVGRRHHAAEPRVDRRAGEGLRDAIGAEARAPRRRRLHHHGRARAHASAQGGQPDAGAEQHRPDVAGGARARRPDPRLAADRRGVRLGRPGVEGADGDDAGHAVRLPVRGAPQAALLVGHDHEPAGPRAGRELAAEGRGDDGVLRRLQGACGTSGSTPSRAST